MAGDFIEMLRREGFGVIRHGTGPPSAPAVSRRVPSKRVWAYDDVDLVDQAADGGFGVFLWFMVEASGSEPTIHAAGSGGTATLQFSFGGGLRFYVSGRRA